MYVCVCWDVQVLSSGNQGSHDKSLLKSMPLILGLEQQRQVDLCVCEFKSTLVYAVSSRPAKVTAQRLH